MNKRILLIILLLLISPVALAIDFDQTNSRYVFSSALDSIGTYWGKSYTQKTEGWFYQLEPWELEYCSSYVTTDLEWSDPTYMAAGNDLKNIYDLTSTLLVTRQPYSTNESLYEINWYVHPKRLAINYSVYLITDEGDREPLIEHDTADTLQGAVGYIAIYNETNYVKAVIIYDDGSILHQTNVINKTIPQRGRVR